MILKGIDLNDPFYAICLEDKTRSVLTSLDGAHICIRAKQREPTNTVVGETYLLPSNKSHDDPLMI